MQAGNTSVLLLVAWLFASVAWPVNNALATHSAKNGGCTGRSLEHLVVERVPPNWPPERGMRVAGDVVVKITIDEDGKIVSARAICGHPMKKSFAIAAVIKWKFRPYMDNGKAKRVSGIVTVHFPTEDIERNNDRKEKTASSTGVQSRTQQLQTSAIKDDLPT